MSRLSIAVVNSVLFLMLPLVALEIMDRTDAATELTINRLQYSAYVAVTLFLILPGTRYENIRLPLLGAAVAILAGLFSLSSATERFDFMYTLLWYATLLASFLLDREAKARAQLARSGHPAEPPVGAHSK
jgi:hypothetical protein